MNISKVAKITGISAKMIRYYEEIGLIPAVKRSDTGYRVYSTQDVERLKFIYQSRQLGFSLEHIKMLIALWQDKDRHSMDVKQVAQQHVDTLSHKINHLLQMKQQLERLINHCAGDQQPECAILKNIEQKIL